MPYAYAGNIWIHSYSMKDRKRGKPTDSLCMKGVTDITCMLW